MAYKDFRDFLSTLEKEGQLLTISEEVKPEPDIASAGSAMSRFGGETPAMLFTNIYGYQNAKIAMNVMGSWPNNALMMGMPKSTPLKDQFFEFASRYSEFPVPVQREETAPFQEVEITENINLF